MFGTLRKLAAKVKAAFVGKQQQQSAPAKGTKAIPYLRWHPGMQQHHHTGPYLVKSGKVRAGLVASVLGAMWRRIDQMPPVEHPCCAPRPKVVHPYVNHQARYKALRRAVREAAR